MPLKNHAGHRQAEALRRVVNETIAEALRGLEPPRLRAALGHALEGGKRVRPLLTMLMCGAVGGRATDAASVAAALEMLHTSSLVHDDIMDHSPLRRGRPTLHVEYDVPTAVLAGDMLVALAFRLVQKQTTGRRGALLDTFSNAFVGLCEGQALDLDLSGRDNVGPELHAVMVEKKTAALLEASAALGALAGGGTEEHVRAASLFGRHLGMAFQAHDDLLDAVGDERIMGKRPGLDARNGRTTYLSLAWPPRETGDSAADPVTRVRRAVARHTGTACALLDALPPTPSRDMLRRLAATLTERES